jgi:CRISPR-associated protein Cmr4
MYERALLMFLYADAPVHFGAGVSLGAVDLPIQRERHTRYPMAQGSGLKGAIRHHLATTRNGDAHRERLDWVFGPDGRDESRPQDHAGAAAFGDGRLLLFPVRSLVGTFAYCTSAVALGRLRRDAELVGLPVPWAAPGTPAEGRALGVPGSKVAVGGKAALEDFDVQVDERPEVVQVARWILEHALPRTEAFAHFRERVASHLLVLADDLFAHLTQLATVVEPHVRIDEETGTASEGAFFYAEHLPADSLLWSLVGVAAPRATADRRPAALEAGLGDAAGVRRTLHEWLDGRAVQVGADATTGRGLVHVRVVGGEQA